MSEFECITCESCKSKGVKGYEFFICNHAQLATVDIDHKVIYPYQQVRPKWCPRKLNVEDSLEDPLDSGGASGV